MSTQVRMIKPRRRLPGHAPGEEPGAANRPPDPLVAETLTPEAEAVRRTVLLCEIPAAGRRMTAVFLGTADYPKIHETVGEVMGNLFMECLPRLVREQGGQILLTALFSPHGEMLNAVTEAIEIDGTARPVVGGGHVFALLPRERVVVSVEKQDTSAGLVSHLVVRSDRDPIAFFRTWREFTRRHNYLRGRAFFADGDLVRRRRRYTWDDVCVSAEVRGAIETHVARFLANRARLKALGVKARRGLILEGPPGTGKTLLGKVLADTLDASFLWVSPRHVEGPRSFQHILELAQFVAPTVVFLEDLDLFAEDREYHGWVGLGELMNQLDGAVDNEDLVTLATANRLSVIEKALRNRPGRFDRVLNLAAMDEECRRRLLVRLLAKAEVSAEDLAYLVSATAEYTGAQVEELVNTLYILAVEGRDEVARSDGSDGVVDDNGDGNGDGRPAPDAVADPLAPAGAAEAAERVAIDRPLIAAALEEFRVELKARVGFHAA